MKTLILTRDDGISAKVWLLRAKSYLERGRRVLAVTEASNLNDCIGRGDGLPSYEEVVRKSGFTSCKLGWESLQLLLAALRTLPADTVVMWNMSLFEWADQSPAWREVIATCSAMEHDMVFMHYAETQWSDGREFQLGDFIGQIAWDRVEGVGVVSESNRDMLKALLPQLAEGLKDEKPGGWRSEKAQLEWQILEGGELKRHGGSVSELLTVPAISGAEAQIRRSNWMAKAMELVGAGKA